MCNTLTVQTNAKFEKHIYKNMWILLTRGDKKRKRFIFFFFFLDGFKGLNGGIYFYLGLRSVKVEKRRPSAPNLECGENIKVKIKGEKNVSC